MNNGIGAYSRLRSINGIESLVQEKTGSPRVVHPRRAVLVEGGVVPQHGDEIGDDEHEARESDEVGRHAHGKKFDDHMGVEWLQNVL